MLHGGQGVMLIAKAEEMSSALRKAAAQPNESAEGRDADFCILKEDKNL
jgi:hypothetical protein